MRFDRELLSPFASALLVVIAVLLLGSIALRWRRGPQPLASTSSAKAAPSVRLPTILTRVGVPFVKPAAQAPAPVSIPPVPPSSPARVLPLALFAAAKEPALPSIPLAAPYGRLIPCETVIALESNRLDTPIIGLVTEDVWHDGRCVVPAGAEVHGRASLDRARERIGSQGSWKIVWRSGDSDNGAELSVDGLVLDRETGAEASQSVQADGSAGLRGEVVRASDDHELKLFAASFLASATTALQDNRLTSGLLGEGFMPAVSARNAALAGTGAVLREYAQQLKDAIARDGFYLRVPAGKAFYLYVTQTLDRGRARVAPRLATTAAPSTP